MDRTTSSITTLVTTRSALLAVLAAFVVLSLGAADLAHTDHGANTSTWPTDKTFYVKPSLDDIAHASFAPAADFEDAADVWNGMPSSWWDLTRSDAGGDVDVGAKSFGRFSYTLAETRYVANNGVMYLASIDFNTAIDFRDVSVSQGWWSYDYKTVAIHEIGHMAGIHDHTGTAGSPMRAYLEANAVDRTPSDHDIATIGGMY